MFIELLSFFVGNPQKKSNWQKHYYYHAILKKNKSLVDS